MVAFFFKCDTAKEFKEFIAYLASLSEDERDRMCVSEQRAICKEEIQEKFRISKFHYGEDTYLDSDDKYTYFVDRIPDKPGVYFFFDSQEKLVYVGSAKNLLKRIPNSFKERGGHRYIKFIGYEETNCEKEARNFESEMINKYKPKLNKQIPYKRSKEWNFYDIDGLGIETVRRSYR